MRGHWLVFLALGGIVLTGLSESYRQGLTTGCIQNRDGHHAEQVAQNTGVCRGGASTFTQQHNRVGMRARKDANGLLFLLAAKAIAGLARRVLHHPRVIGKE